jgi:ABC-type lipoprotein release transport system permease subunit
MAAVFFAVMLAVIMNSLQQGVYDKMIENVVGFYSGYAQVHQKGYWEDQVLDNTFVEADSLAEKILADERVKDVIPRLESFALAASREKSAPATVVGTDPGREDLLTNLKEKLSGGEFLQMEDRAVLIGDGLGEELGLGVGDTLVLMGQGYHGINAAGKYPIKGLLHFGSPDLNKTLVYLPLPVAQQLYGTGERLTSYVLMLERGKDAPAVVSSLQGQLDTAQYEVMTWKTMMPGMVQMMEADVGGNYITLGILYLVIAFGIFGTVLMMTQERQYEFGVMVAVGMKRLKLASVVVFEMIFLAALGVASGLLVSTPIAFFFNRNPIYLGDEMAEVYEAYGFDPVMPASLEPSIFWSQGIVVLVITLLIALYPFWRISRLDAVSAMHT